MCKNIRKVFFIQIKLRYHIFNYITICNTHLARNKYKTLLSFIYA